MDIGSRVGNFSTEELEAAIAEHEHFNEMFLQTYAEVHVIHLLGAALKLSDGFALFGSKNKKYALVRDLLIYFSSIYPILLLIFNDL